MGNSKYKDRFGRRLMMRYCLIVLLYSTIGTCWVLHFAVCSSHVDVVQEDNVKIVRAGVDVNLTCTFSNVLQSTKAWFKQTTDGKSLQIVSIYLNQQPSWNEDFEKKSRFNVTKGDDHFNLTILKTKPSDSAAYYCVVSLYHVIGMGAGTRLVVRDAAIGRNITLQQSLIDTVHPGDSVSLQCSIFTESCSGEHSVYWFRQSSGESQGVLYTKGERNGQCENSTETRTQSCVYNLFKSNINLSDAGIYYCAVTACGEILFGKGTELNFRDRVDVNPALLVLGVLNVIFLTLAVFLGIKLFQDPNKKCQSEDILSFAAKSSFLANEPEVKITEEHSLVTYSMYTKKTAYNR